MKKRLLLLSGVLFTTMLCNNVSAQAINEGFEDITTLVPGGWAMNNLSAPIGTNPSWSQGSATGPFPAFNGAGYLSANYNNTAGAGTISNWLMTPNLTFTNGDVISFYSRTVTGAVNPDRLQVRLSTNAASVNVGTTGTSVGDFTTLLLEINPTLISGATGYPDTWTQYTITVSGLAGPTSGRMAFRYFVTNGGPSGANSDFIGIDDFVYTPFGTPVAANVTASNPVKNYTSIPLSQVTALPLTATVTNNGTASTSDAMLTVDVYQLPNLVTPIQTTTSTPSTIAMGANAVQTAGTFLPTSVGDYLIRYISSCTGNTVTTADTATYSVSVSSTMYARDNGQISGAFGIGAGPTGYLGAMYTITTATELDSVLIALNKPGTGTISGDGVGDSTRITVFNVAAGIPNTIIGQSPAYVFTPADTLGLVISTHAISAIGGGNLSLAPGVYYVAITEYNTNVGAAYSDNIFKTNTYYTSWPAQPWAGVETFGPGFSKALVIRPILNDCVTTSSSTSTNVCYGANHTYTDGLTVTGLVANQSHMITMTNAAGCDSVITEMVVVDAQIDLTITASAATLTSNEAGATYQWLDCTNGNMPIASQTAQMYTATATGSYAVVVTVGSCSDTSACQSVTVLGVNELNAVLADLYPNPTNGNVKVLLNETGTVKYAVMTIDGKVVFEGESAVNNFNLDLSGQAKGVYMLNIEQNSLKGTYRLIKE